MSRWLHNRLNAGREPDGRTAYSPDESVPDVGSAGSRFSQLDEMLRNEVPEAIRAPSPRLRLRTLHALREQHAADAGRRWMRRVSPILLSGLAAAAAIAWIWLVPGRQPSDPSVSVPLIETGGMRLHGFTPAFVSTDQSGQRESWFADPLEAALDGMQAFGLRLSSQLPSESNSAADRRPSLW
jgi:hypothetical protein